MNRHGQTIVLGLLGISMIALVWTGHYLTYVQDWSRWPLVLSGAILLWMAVAAQRPGARRGVRDRGPRAAWLLLAPVIVLQIAPPPLGSYVAEQRAAPVPTPHRGSLPGLPQGATPDMAVVDFVLLSTYEPGSLAGRQIRLTGFVSRDQQGHWYLTRMAIHCCAADAIPYRVRVDGADSPDRDTWVRVVGRSVPRAADRLIGSTPTLLAASVETVDQPRDPYE